MLGRIYDRSALLTKTAATVVALLGTTCLAAPPAQAGGISVRVGHGGYHGGKHGSPHGGYHRGYRGSYSGRTFSFKSYGHSHRPYSYRPPYPLGHFTRRPYYGTSTYSYSHHGYSASRYWRPRVRIYDDYYGNGYKHEESRRGRGAYGYTLKPDAYLKPTRSSAHPYALEAPKAAIPSSRMNQLSEPLPATDADAAWEALASGKVDEARSLFAQQALATPRDPLPKVGFSLASALSGRLAQGAWSMRRAFEADPESLEVALSNEALIDRVETLRKKYRAAGEALDARDGMFMVAALAYFSADSQEAVVASARLADTGDSSESARSLALLSQSLARGKAPGPG